MSEHFAGVASTEKTDVKAKPLGSLHAGCNADDRICHISTKGNKLKDSTVWRLLAVKTSPRRALWGRERWRSPVGELPFRRTGRCRKTLPILAFGPMISILRRRGRKTAFPLREPVLMEGPFERQVVFTPLPESGEQVWWKLEREFLERRPAFPGGSSPGVGGAAPSYSFLTQG